MKSISRYEGYELPVAANFTASQISFPDIPELRSDTTQDTVIMSAEVFTADSLPLNYSGTAGPTFAQVNNAFLTLYILGFQQFYRIPLIKLLSTQAATTAAGGYYFQRSVFQFNPIRVDWTKSYLSFATPPNNANRFSYMFLFGYEWLPPGAYAKYLQAQQNQFAQGVIPIR